jgi:hypothetical protein
LTELGPITVQIRDLKGPYLGLAYPAERLVLIDHNAAGYGWDRIDLLSVVSHELGHLLGFDHGTTSGIMVPALSPGEKPGRTSDTLGVSGFVNVAARQLDLPGNLAKIPSHSRQVIETLPWDGWDAKWTLSEKHRTFRVRDQLFAAFASESSWADVAQLQFPRLLSNDDENEAEDQLYGLLADAREHDDTTDKDGGRLLDGELLETLLRRGGVW